MLSQNSKYNVAFKVVSILLVHAFFVSNMAFAIEKPTKFTLSPPSRFNPIVKAVWNGKQYDISEDKAEVSKLNTGLQEDAAFLYLNILISQLLRDMFELKGYGMSPKSLQVITRLEELKKSIAKNLPHINFDRFHYEEMTVEGSTICLPFSRKDNGRRQMLRYYLVDDKTKESQNELVAIPILGFADKLDKKHIPSGVDGLEIIMESEIENLLGNKQYLWSNQLTGINVKPVLLSLNDHIEKDRIDPATIKTILMVGAVKEEVEGVIRILPGRLMTIGNLYRAPLEEILDSPELGKAGPLRIVRVDASDLDPNIFPDSSYDLWFMNGIEEAIYSVSEVTALEAKNMINRIIGQALRVVRSGGHIYDGMGDLNKKLYQDWIRDGYIQHVGYHLYQRTAKLLPPNDAPRSASFAAKASIVAPGAPITPRLLDKFNPVRDEPDLNRERNIAINFRDAIIDKAVKAKKQGQYIFLGLEETWIKNKSGPQTIISEIERLPESLRQRGLDNVIFGRGKGDAFAGVIGGERERFGARLPLSNIVVVGSQSILRSEAYNALRSNALQESAFLIGTDNSHLDFKSGTRLLEMYLLGLKLNSVQLPDRSDPRYEEKVKEAYETLLKTLDQKFIKIGFSFNGKFWDFIFTPIEPYDINQFRKINDIQIKEIDAKA